MIKPNHQKIKTKTKKLCQNHFEWIEGIISRYDAELYHMILQIDKQVNLGTSPTLSISEQYTERWIKLDKVCGEIAMEA